MAVSESSMTCITNVFIISLLKKFLEGCVNKKFLLKGCLIYCNSVIYMYGQNF